MQLQAVTELKSSGERSIVVERSFLDGEDFSWTDVIQEFTEFPDSSHWNIADRKYVTCDFLCLTAGDRVTAAVGVRA